jgi:hypothetical protein
MSRGVCVELKSSTYVSGVSWTSPRHEHAPQQKPAPRGIGSGVRTEASIEGVRFRWSLQAASRVHSLLTHRNLSHAGRRLKRAFRFRKFFGYFLPKKVTTRTNTALCLRHGVGRDAPGLDVPSGTGVPRDTCYAERVASHRVRAAP